MGEVKFMGEIEKLAKRLAEEYIKTSPPHRPENVLPACHYLACVAKGKRMTQREIARISGTSTVTIRKVWKGVVKRVGAIGDRDYDELFGEGLEG